jgi:hypothetical protein
MASAISEVPGSIPPPCGPTMAKAGCAPRARKTKVDAGSFVLRELFKVVVFVGHGNVPQTLQPAAPFYSLTHCSLAENDEIAVRRPHEEKHRQ